MTTTTHSHKHWTDQGGHVKETQAVDQLQASLALPLEDLIEQSVVQPNLCINLNEDVYPKSCWKIHVLHQRIGPISLSDLIYYFVLHSVFLYCFFRKLCW